MQPLEIIRTGSDQSLRQQAFLIRRRVFVDEQQVPEELEFDALDHDAVHLLASRDGRPLGTLRIRFPGSSIAKIERVAVLREARGLKVGRRLVQAALDVAHGQGIEQVVLHAQVQARRFYESLGFAASGGTFIEDGIVHVAMHLRLTTDVRSGVP